MAGGHTTVLAYNSRYSNPEYMGAMFRDSTFAGAYIRALDRMSASGYLEQLFEALAGELEQALAILHREFPTYQFDSSVLHTNQNHLRTFLYPPTPFQVHYAGHDDTSISLMMGGVHQLSYDIAGVTLFDSLDCVSYTHVTLAPKSAQGRSKLRAWPLFNTCGGGMARFSVRAFACALSGKRPDGHPLQSCAARVSLWPRLEH